VALDGWPGMSKIVDSRERRPEGWIHLPYFQYDGLGGVNWTFARNCIVFGVSWLC